MEFMISRDRLGRVRTPHQNRGLRPLHPKLPTRWVSRAVRLAMSETDWTRFEALVRHHHGTAPSQARACGQALSALMDEAARPRIEPGPLDWMDWERRKTLRLVLRAS
jgi:hypothetical protein